MTTTFIFGNDGTINYFRVKSMVTGKKAWLPVIVRKPLKKMFSRKRDAEMYARVVLARYQSLLSFMVKEVSNNEIESIN